MSYFSDIACSSSSLSRRPKFSHNTRKNWVANNCTHKNNRNSSWCLPPLLHLLPFLPSLYILISLSYSLPLFLLPSLSLFLLLSIFLQSFLPLYLPFLPSSSTPLPSPTSLYLFIKHITTYLTVTTTASCCCNFSLCLKKRPHGGVRLRLVQVDREMGQLHMDVHMLSAWNKHHSLETAGTMGSCSNS